MKYILRHSGRVSGRVLLFRDVDAIDSINPSEIYDGKGIVLIFIQLI